jgi:hypothetical protein
VQQTLSHVGGDSGAFGDRQEVWERSGTLFRLSRDRGQWWCYISRSGTGVWLDADAVAGAMGLKTTAPIERVADIAGHIDDRVFAALRPSMRHAP